MFLKTSLPPKGKNTSRLTPSLEMTSVIIFQNEHSSVDGYIFFKYDRAFLCRCLTRFMHCYSLITN